MEYTVRLREWRLGLARLGLPGRVACLATWFARPLAFPAAWLARTAGLPARPPGWLALAGRSAAEKKEGLSQ